ncbi:MAG: DUF1343 domain-containing protein [Bacteroidetes bacterium]|nr:DUF1343 domain-containing protein [Bacteroidota bacterium]
MKKYFLILFFVFLHMTGLPQIRCGAERTELYYPALNHKSIAVVANAASLAGKINTVDMLLRDGLKVEKIFCPEHGFRSFTEAGQVVKNSFDTATKLPVISLYGKKKRPEPLDLEEIDIVVFDLQDVGVRFYTYLSTLSYMMEACSQANIPMMLLDRPNPNGFYIDGPVMDSSLFSFVGLHPVPVVYGMTIGEYAKMINEEGWLKNRMICELQVIPLENYTHASRYELPANPSPNLRTMDAVYLYPSLCLFEGTFISVGRGTPWPFEIYGHPAFKGFSYEFYPQPVRGGAEPLYSGQFCRGLDLRDFYKSRPRLLGRLNLSWLIMAYQTLGSDPHFFNDFFDRLAGTPLLRQQIKEGKSEMEIRQSWQPGLEKFKEIRAKYLLYPE